MTTVDRYNNSSTLVPMYLYGSSKKKYMIFITKVAVVDCRSRTEILYLVTYFIS